MTTGWEEVARSLQRDVVQLWEVNARLQRTITRLERERDTRQPPTDTDRDLIAATRDRGLCGYFWRAPGGGRYVCQEPADHPDDHRDGAGTHPSDQVNA